MKKTLSAILFLALIAASLTLAPLAPGQGRAVTRFPAITTAGYADGNGNSDWIWVDANTTMTLQTRKSGTISGCSIHLQGTSLERADNPTDADAFSLTGAQTCTSNVMLHIANKPVKMIRIHVDSFSGSSTPSVQPIVFR